MFPVIYQQKNTPGTVLSPTFIQTPTEKCYLSNVWCQLFTKRNPSNQANLTKSEHREEHGNSDILLQTPVQSMKAITWLDKQLMGTFDTSHIINTVPTTIAEHTTTISGILEQISTSAIVESRPRAVEVVTLPTTTGLTTKKTTAGPLKSEIEAVTLSSHSSGQIVIMNSSIPLCDKELWYRAFYNLFSMTNADYIQKICYVWHLYEEETSFFLNLRHLLLKWLISSVPSSTDVKISEQDLNAITMHFCNNLISIGVLKQVPEKTELELFNSMSTYQWTHIDSSREAFALSSPAPENGIMKLAVSTPNGKTLAASTMQTDIVPAEARNLLIRLPRYNANEIASEEMREEDFSITENRETCERSDLLKSNSIAIIENGQKETLPNDNIIDHTAQTDPNVIKSETLCIKCKSVNQNKKIMIDQYVQVSAEDAKNDNDTVDENVIKQTSVASIIPPPPPPLLFNLSTNITKAPAPPPLPGFSSTAAPVIIVPPLPPPLPTNSANVTPAPPPPPASALKLNCDSRLTTLNVPTVHTPNPAGDLPRPLPNATEGGWFKDNVTRKNVLNPPKPMRPLWWTRIVTSPPPPSPIPNRDTPDEEIEKDNNEPSITNKISSTKIWQQIDETNLDNLDEFTELFSRQAVITNIKPKEKKEVRVKTVKVLNSKRSQNIGILARSLHCDVDEIEQGVCNVDTSLVTLETLQQIISIQGTEEELEMINEASKGDVPLDYPEMFLLNISKICMFSERVSCLVFQQEFEEATTQISRKLEVVERVSHFLMENEELKHVLSIILTLGNYMNAGNRQRGQADGFALEILGKLKDVKSNESQTTLLHFIVRTYVKRRIKDGLHIRDIPLPVPEPADVERAAQVNFEEVKEQIKDLQERITGCKKTAELVEQTSSARAVEPFRSKMREFIQHATVSIDNHHTGLENCQKLFIDTMKYYYFTPKSKALKDCTPDQFYECWTNFSNDFKDIWKKEIATSLTEVMNKMKKIQNQARKNVKTTSTKPGGLKERMLRLTKK